MNLKKQVEEKQQKIKEITDTTKDQNIMIKELKEEKSKLSKVFNDKDDLIKELKNKIASKDEEIQAFDTLTLTRQEYQNP